MSDIVSVREFARRMGVSLPAVQKAVKTGRIDGVVGDNGKLKGIDWDTQKDAWTANSNPAQRRVRLAHTPDGEDATPFPAAEGTNRGGRPRKDGQPPKGTPAPAPTLEPDTSKGASLAEIKRAREAVNLQLDKLKLDVEKKKYVPADSVHTEGAKLAATLVSSLYNIPDQVSPELASMTDAMSIRALLIAELDKAVEGIRKAYGR